MTNKGQVHQDIIILPKIHHSLFIYFVLLVWAKGVSLKVMAGKKKDSLSLTPFHIFEKLSL